MLWKICGAIFVLWLVYNYLIEIGLILEEPDDYNKNWRKPVLTCHVYTSQRFIITGNIAWRIVITDKHEDLAYILQHSELAKFRRNFEYVKGKNKDKYIMTALACKTGRKAA